MKKEFYSKEAGDEAIIQLKTVSGKTAADISAGEGFMSEGLLNAGLKVLAVDSSPESVSYLKEKFADIKEFSALLSDPENIKLQDNSVDYVFANMHLHHTEVPSAALKEIIRILIPGGKCAVIDLLLHEQGESIKGHGNRWPGFTFPDIYDWFINAGFKNISIEKLSRPVSIVNDRGDEVHFSVFIACGDK